MPKWSFPVVVQVRKGGKPPKADICGFSSSHGCSGPCSQNGVSSKCLQRIQSNQNSMSGQLTKERLLGWQSLHEVARHKGRDLTAVQPNQLGPQAVSLFERKINILGSLQ
jgi:hypothetical protein